jgi:hypothetical protein
MVTLRIFIILDERSAVAVHGNCAVDFLSNSDLVSHSVTIVGAFVTNCDIWIAAGLGLTHLKRVSRAINRYETVKWSN